MAINCIIFVYIYYMLYQKRYHIKKRYYTLDAKCLNPIKVAVLSLFIHSHMLIHQIKMTADTLSVFSQVNIAFSFWSELLFICSGWCVCVCLYIHT